MKIPFIKWVSSSEGMITMLRLLTAIVMVLVACLDKTTQVVWFLGVPVICFGLLTMIRMGIVFAKRKEFKTMLDGEKQSGFVQDGFYAYCRHPFYFGFAVAMVGLTISFFSLTMFALLVYYFQCTYFASIEEEKRLIRDFPDYKQYQWRVPRFIPKQWKPFFKI